LRGVEIGQPAAVNCANGIVPVMFAAETEFALPAVPAVVAVVALPAFAEYIAYGVGVMGCFLSRMTFV